MHVSCLSQQMSQGGKSRENTASGKSGLGFQHFKANAKDPNWLFLSKHSWLTFHIKLGCHPNNGSTGWMNAGEEKGEYSGHHTANDSSPWAELQPAQQEDWQRYDVHSRGASGMADEQFGSQKGLVAIDHGLNKMLTCDISWQLKLAFGLCTNDAKSCYDHIVHAFTRIAMEQVRMHVEPLICMFMTLQNLEHTVCMVYGDSDISFSGKLWVVPFQGIGQGNGTGPATWVVVSTPILNMLCKLGYRAFLQRLNLRRASPFCGVHLHGWHRHYWPASKHGGYL